MEVKLDEHQLKAVRHFKGPALVVAGPGSGKTTVIIERILHLIRHHNVDPENILAIAFTNAAADEMKDRINNRFQFTENEPLICTLHVFGKDLITNHYKQAGFISAPNNIWDADKIKEIINKEKYRLKQSTETEPVYIYKVEGLKTGRCYIGQTIDLERRESEHRMHSSNRRLRDALSKGNEDFEFRMITKVDGKFADYIESQQIKFHRNRSVVKIDEINKMEDGNRNETDDSCVFIYTIKSKTTSVCYFGLSNNPEHSIELHFTESPNELLREAIENEEIDLSSFEIIAEERSWEYANNRLEREALTHKKWAVFNDEDPLYARDSTRRRIEVFCEYFDVSYEEVLKHTECFKHEMRQFDESREDIEKVKRKVKSGLFEPDKITDPILRAFAKKYETLKNDARAIDFLDMLIYSANMLENNPKLLCELREKYKFVFVDEFQDLSPIDFRLIKLFPDNLFAVGDDDQAIYGFRGGDSNIMQKEFGNWKNIQKYEISQNYRSTSNIVMYSKALIENNNPTRINKDLRATMSSKDEIKFSDIAKHNVKDSLLNELSKILSSDIQNVGILARNWKGEINAIQDMLDCSEVRKLGFRIKFDEIEHMDRDIEAVEEVRKLKMSLQKDLKKVEIVNIHSAKGREWDRVILLVNTMYVGIPDKRNNLLDERRLFYVAVTRAKQELVIYDGGNCKFVSEFQELPYSERKKRLEEYHARLFSAFDSLLNQARASLKEVSHSLLTTLKTQNVKLLEIYAKNIRKLYEPDLAQLLQKNVEIRNVRSDIESDLTQQLETAQKSFVEELIPIYDQLDSIVNKYYESTQFNDLSVESLKFYDTVRNAYKKFLYLLEDNGLKKINTPFINFDSREHSEIQSRVFSNEVPEDTVVRILRPGYKSNKQVIRKAQVVVSKGKKQSEWLTILGSVQPICFVTKERIYMLYDIKLHSNIITGVTALGSVIRIQELDLLFVLSKRNLKSIKPKRLSTEPSQETKSISDDFLRSVTVMDEGLDVNLQRSAISLVLKTGYILKGHIQSFDRDVLYMSINKRIVIVFRHAILEVNPDLDLEQSSKIKSSIGEKTDNQLNSLTESPSEIKRNKSHSAKIKTDRQKKPVQKNNGSYARSRSETWINLLDAYTNKATVKGTITRTINGGLRVKIDSLQGFIPKSQIGYKKNTSPESYVGKSLEMKILKCDKHLNLLVLSHRAWLKEKRDEFFANLEIGHQVTGKVKNIKDFGVFVDLGVIDGLIHKTELTWKRIHHPSEVVSEGDEIEVKVISYNREDKKISLSLKQMSTDPWETIDEKCTKGLTAKGTVVNVVDYGAFIELEEGVVGLLHVSEFPQNDGAIKRRELLKEGDEVDVIVLKVSKETRKISLSMKQTQDNRLNLLLQKYPDKNRTT